MTIGWNLILKVCYFLRNHAQTLNVGLVLMKWKFKAIASFSFAIFILMTSSVPPSSLSAESPISIDFVERAMQDLLAILVSYPEHVTGLDIIDSKIYLVMKSGKRLPYDDGKFKTFEEKLTNADIQDMMEQIYPLTFGRRVPPPFYDPGRFRCYDFFAEVYGRSKDEVERNLELVETPFGTFLFNVRNSASRMFLSAMVELSRQVNENPHLRPFIEPLAGTYNYRFVADTNLLSPHAFGIAVDINPVIGAYWRWATYEMAQRRLKEYPEIIVRTFEKYGFIWGGKWYHFDLMHFEYRPELIFKSRYFTKVGKACHWYGDVPANEYRREIEMVEKAFQKWKNRELRR